MFSPISVNFLTEAAKVLFAVVMLILQARCQNVGEKPLLSISTFMQAAWNNVLTVPALLYAINNYIKFIMQLYFNPATVKLLSNLKVLVIAVLLKMIMRHRFSVIQFEALALLLIGISVNQLRSLPEGTTALSLPVTTGSYIYTLIFVTVPSLASIYNEYALKSQYETSIYLQALVALISYKDIQKLQCFLCVTMQPSEFYPLFSSNMQFFSPLSKVKDEQQNGKLELVDYQDNHRSKESFINMAAGANEETSHHVGPDEGQPLLPT